MARRRDDLLTAEDFRRAARRRLPRLFFDYIDGDWMSVREAPDKCKVGDAMVRAADKQVVIW